MHLTEQQNKAICSHPDTWPPPVSCFMATFRRLWGNVSMTTKCGQTLGYLRLDLRLIWQM